MVCNKESICEKNMEKRTRCITFDLDDTLWAIAPVIHRAELKFYAWLDSYYPRITRAMSPQALIEHRHSFMRDKATLMHDLTHLRKLWMREVAKLGGYGEALVEPGFQIFWQARNEVALFDQVEQTLEALGKNYQIGAVSNGNADVNYIGIGHLFDFTVNSEEVGKTKPDKKIFQLAAVKAGVGIEQILHVGDDMEADVIGALNAGASAAWVTDNPARWDHKTQPDIIVSHISELVDLLT